MVPESCVCCFYDLDMLCFSMRWFSKGFLSCNPAFSFSKHYLPKLGVPLVMECLPSRPACTCLLLRAISFSSFIYSADVLNSRGGKAWNAQQLAERSHGGAFGHIRGGKRTQFQFSLSIWMSLLESRDWANWSFLWNQLYSWRQPDSLSDLIWTLFTRLGDLHILPAPVGSASALLEVWVKGT